MGEERATSGFVRLFESVGQEDVEALPAGHRESGFGAGDLQGELQVAYRVGRHQQLETEQPRQQMVSHVVRPRPSEPLALDGRPDRRDDLPEEGAGAGCGVENQHARALCQRPVSRLEVDHIRIGKTVREVEPVAQQAVDAAHDVGHDRLWRVVDAPHLAQFRVIRGEEILVEVDHWIIFHGSTAEIGQDSRHVRTVEQRRQIVHDPSDALVDTRPGDPSENVPQKRRRLGENGGLARERPGTRLMAAPRREQPVGRGLSLHIRKIEWREVADQDFPVGVQQIVQGPRFALLSEYAVYAVTQEPGLSRHPFGEVAGVVDGRRGGGEERAQQGVDLPSSGTIGHDTVVSVQAPDTRRLA